MNTWILLLLLLCGSNGCGSDRDASCRNERGGGQGRERSGGNGREREHDCGCDRERERERDCDGNDSRFEPRFDARPFSGGDTCGCEEKNN